MPKHIHPEHYLTKPYALFPKSTIHPEIEHVPSDADHYMLPTVFTLEKGEKVMIVQYPGPGVFYIYEGEIEYKDVKNPGQAHKLGAGSVLHVEKGEKLSWYSPSVGKGFAVFWVPVSVKGFDSFVVYDD